jgi:hypothetical protein
MNPMHTIPQAQAPAAVAHFAFDRAYAAYYVLRLFEAKCPREPRTHLRSAGREVASPTGHQLAFTATLIFLRADEQHGE